MRRRDSSAHFFWGDRTGAAFGAMRASTDSRIQSPLPETGTASRGVSVRAIAESW